MTWVRVDDSAHERPQLATVSDTAVTLWLYGLMWNNRTLANGTVATAIVTRILGPQRGLTPDAALGAAGELVASGAWRATPDGFQIVYGADLQPSRADVEAQRSKWAAKKARQRYSRVPGGQAGGRTGTGSGTGSEEEEEDPQDPNQDSVSSSSSLPLSPECPQGDNQGDAMGAVYSRYREVFGSAPTVAQRRRLADMAESYGNERVVEPTSRSSLWQPRASLPWSSSR